MGLAEQIKAGASLERRLYSTVATSTGFLPITSAYIILGIQTDIPCRFRLYDNEASRNDVTEQARVFGSSNIADSISLVGDFSMSAVGTYTVDPVLYGVPQDQLNAFYRVEGTAGTPNITLKVFPLYDANYPATPLTPYSLDNRRTIIGMTGSLSEGQLHFGTIETSTIPKTYLLVSASLSVGSHRARLRLYRSSASISDVTEQTRPFSTEPSASVNLLVDMILTGSTATYFTPKIVGTNLQNMGTNLLLIKNNNELRAGKNELYYILQNENTTGGTVNISASLSVYSLED